MMPVIVDDKSEECETGVEGEIQIRGPNVMKEYLYNPEATEDTLMWKWLRTGDLGRMDEEGYVFVTGRLKELIIKGGENIAPREIDEALYEHPDVVEAAALPALALNMGSEWKRRFGWGAKHPKPPVMSYWHYVEKVGAFKAPNQVHIINELPNGPSGKIQRLHLNELLYKS